VLNPKQIDSPETVSKPSDEKVRRLVRNLMPRLQKVLLTRRWVARFFEEVALQWSAADETTPGGEVDEVGAIADADCGKPSLTEVAPFACAA
jgi:hypothetical protein